MTFLTLQNPESVLEVLDREIRAEKWISKEERARLVGMVWGEVPQGFGGPQQDAEAAAEAERLRKLQEDDGGRQKALITMMGGTLRTKKDLSPLEVLLLGAGVEGTSTIDPTGEGGVDGHSTRRRDG